MNVLVTGATGFVGGHLVEALLARGDTITALVRDQGKARDFARRGVKLVVGGFDDPAALARAVEGQEIVYHLAGAVAARNEAEFLGINRGGTKGLAAAAVAAGSPRFVLVSSLAAGGPTTPGHPLQGDEPPHPVTMYGRSKLAGEAAIRATSLPWTIVRPPAVYGPGDREMLRIFRAAALGVAPVFGTGAQELSLVYGPDLAEALVAAGTNAGTVHGTFYASHAEVVTSRRLIELAGAASNRRPLVLPLPSGLARSILWVTGTAATLANRATILSADKAAEFLAPAWIVDSRPLAKVTGWTARTDFAMGARLTVEWYRSRGWM